ncbi:MAG TPA: class I SAM-dependent methyltransferase [Bacteroidia bacterium]|jgi:ubiquinone/menaquinone biosynthesis C-methylase UbiE|nr:class I SAM-dependent methyltransferase [Bacteroidia bacterium]
MNPHSQAAVYSKENVVKHYVAAEGLQKPEQIILKKLEDKLSNMTVLDMGIGGGRTTAYFAGKVKKYTGIDFSEKMIEACKLKFEKKHPNIELLTEDARNLSRFKNEEFDLVLFSFNGIDHIDHQERQQVLAEIRRICKKDGDFIFSSHNIFYVPNLSKVHFRFNIFKMLQAVFKRSGFVTANKIKLETWQEKDHIILFDAMNDFGLHIYYTKPSFEAENLRRCGFKNIDVYDVNGVKINLAEEAGTGASPWLYYHCR